MKLVYWGIGNNFHEVRRKIEYCPDFFNDEIIAYLDNNSKLWGTEYDGKEIMPPNTLYSLCYDKIVITSMHTDEIKNQLVCELYVNSSDILTFDEYCMSKYAEASYKLKYKNSRGRNPSQFDLSKIIIYTAILGDYDSLKEPEFIDSALTYVCFTNNRSLKSEYWNIEYVNDCVSDSRKVARDIKLQPHQYFKDYETSVWVDGKFQIKKDMRDYIEQYGGSQEILCFPHFERNCIYSEAAACIYSGRGDKRKIISQICNYYANGYPFDKGLYETGCIIRKHNNDLCKKIMEEWKDEINQYSLRDQISFPYVCWKNNFEPDICDLFINNNEWLQFVWHNRYY